MKKNLGRCAYAQGKFVKSLEALENIDDEDKNEILIKSYAHLGKKYAFKKYDQFALTI